MIDAEEQVQKSVRKIGNNLAFEGGVRTALSFTARLLVGYLARLPVTAISVNAAIAFLGTAAFEIPAGLFADLQDPVAIVRLGYFCQVACAALLFVGIAMYPVAPAIMWVCICVEGLLDAVGNACISGAKEAAFLRMIERHHGLIEESAYNKMRVQFLSLAERHGRWMIIVWPTVALSLALWLNLSPARNRVCSYRMRVATRQTLLS